MTITHVEAAQRVLDVVGWLQAARITPPNDITLKRLSALPAQEVVGYGIALVSDTLFWNSEVPDVPSPGKTRDGVRNYLRTGLEPFMTDAAPC